MTYQAGKYIGIVRDHYRNGNTEWEGFLISDEPDVVNVTATPYPIYYNEDGTEDS